MKKDKPIAGNTRDGRLYITGVQEKFIGERRTMGGKFESKTFYGKKADATREWEEWRAESLEEANIKIEKTRPRLVVGEEPKVAVKTQKASNNEKMFVLTFRGQRSQKNVAVFENDDSALRMADALTIALEATGMDGSYDVEELPVWQ